jgi:hypothetical protein
MSAAVVSTSVIGSAATTIQAGGGSAGHLVAERARVREEERRVEPEHHQARELLGVGIAAHVVPPGQRRHTAEHGLVRPQCPPEDVRDRESDRDDDAGQDAEQGHAEECGDRQPALRPPLSPQADNAGDVRERERRDDPDGGERRLGQVAEQAGKREQHRRDGDGADEAGDLRPRARLLGDGRTGAARADREALEQPRGDVRGADAQHLPIPVDLLAAASRERRCGRDGVGQRDERDPERAPDQERDVGRVDVGDRQRREPLRERADQIDAVALEPEGVGGRD